MPKRFATVAAALIAAALALPAAAQAGPCRPQNAQQQDGRGGGGRQLTVNEVISKVERSYGGKVVGVQESGQGADRFYHVRVLQRDGRVKTVTVPAGGGR